MAQAEPANLTAILPVVVLASSVSIMSTDIYTPSLPHLPEYFATTPQAVQLTISLNIIAFALAQLVLAWLGSAQPRPRPHQPECSLFVNVFICS